ncbi:hypothetical protein NPIL_379001 [Nephila pilipes]|uniref:Uncharacterized protein n=1 Tax=Nephila pilipes TaxID=299642 RepID=A0A8X6QTW8_NEPPI|nr:hypothetical protein NPIL_379001 [Nephila pilipes]
MLHHVVATLRDFRLKNICTSRSSKRQLAIPRLAKSSSIAVNLRTLRIGAEPNDDDNVLRRSSSIGYAAGRSRLVLRPGCFIFVSTLPLSDDTARRAIA